MLLLLKLFRAIISFFIKSSYLRIIYPYINFEWIESLATIVERLFFKLSTKPKLPDTFIGGQEVQLVFAAPVLIPGSESNCYV